MNTPYTATNGITVIVDEARGQVLTKGSPDNASHIDALREFFRAERDEELGRWRWPENPDYVVYPLGLDATDRRYAAALHEPSGITGRWQEGQYRTVPPTEATDLGILAVAAYFEAHPERKPWEDAKPGDVWVFEVEGVESIVALAVTALFHTKFVTVTGSPFNTTSSVITGGRRIWPEDAS